MTRPSPETTCSQWGVPLAWARSYPAWPDSLRDWLRSVRAIGLTQITVRLQAHEVELIATKPGDPDGFTQDRYA